MGLARYLLRPDGITTLRRASGICQDAGMDIALKGSRTRAAVAPEERFSALPC